VLFLLLQKNSSNTEIVCNYILPKLDFIEDIKNKSSSGIMILFKIKAILNKINVLRRKT
jgi:hypothetical protein